MARQLTIAEVIDKNKIASDRVWLYAMKIYVVDNVGSPIEELRLVRNDEDRTIGGELYTAMDFSVDKKVTTSSPAGVTISAQDQTRYLQTRLQQYFGAVGFKVELIVTLMDATGDNGDLTPDLVETYSVVSTSANDYAVQIELGAENPLNVLMPSRMQYKDRCSFRYKSDECGYVGGLTSCDFTLDGANGCTFHSNAERFGGYPGINVR